MRKILHMVFILVVSLFCICCEEGDPAVSIPFEHNNVYVNIQNLDKFTRNVYFSETELLEHFKPNLANEADKKYLVNFSKNFAVAITGKSTNAVEKIEVAEVLKKGEVIYVRYTIESISKASQPQRACTVASIGREYMGYDLAFQDITGFE